jgi:RHH-type rel operon transcriptional repressor/antitoxin RelB
MVTLRLNPATDRKLTRLAKSRGMTKTAIAREALVERLEEAEDIRIAEDRLKRLDAGKSRTYSMAEVKRELGLSV